MSVLTLAMMQVSEINYEDFLHLRSLGMARFENCERAHSPTSESGSSGIGSLTSRDEERDSTSDSREQRIERTSTPNEGEGNEPLIRRPNINVNNNKFDAKNADFQSETQDDIKIVYQGRDLLNLAGNLRWNSWQANVPLISSKMPDCYKRNYEVFRSNFGYKGYKMKRCDKCTFKSPAIIT